MKSKLLYQVATIALVSLIYVSVAHAEWTSAPASPPSNNTDAPINVGTISQKKTSGIFANFFTAHVGTFTNFNVKEKIKVRAGSVEDIYSDISVGGPDQAADAIFRMSSAKGTFRIVSASSASDAGSTWIQTGSSPTGGTVSNLYFSGMNGSPVHMVLNGTVDRVNDEKLKVMGKVKATDFCITDSTKCLSTMVSGTGGTTATEAPKNTTRDMSSGSTTFIPTITSGHIMIVSLTPHDSCPAGNYWITVGDGGSPMFNMYYNSGISSMTIQGYAVLNAGQSYRIAIAKPSGCKLVNAIVSIIPNATSY